ADGCQQIDEPGVQIHGECCRATGRWSRGRRRHHRGWVANIRVCHAAGDTAGRWGRNGDRRTKSAASAHSRQTGSSLLTIAAMGSTDVFDAFFDLAQVARPSALRYDRRHAKNFDRHRGGASDRWIVVAVVVQTRSRTFAWRHSHRIRERILLFSPYDVRDPFYHRLAGHLVHPPLVLRALSANSQRSVRNLAAIANRI